MEQGTGQGARDETAAERLDRNYAELVQELRVAQTGVQILFAFLLTLPFLADFPRADPDFRAVYTVALLGAAAAATCFIAPVAFHRVLFRQGRKAALVLVSHLMALLGLGFLLVTVAGACWIVMARLWTERTAWWTVAGVVAVTGLLWFAVPFLVGRREP